MLQEEAREYHASGRPGKIAIAITKPCATQHDLALAYTPGVAVPVLDIQQDPLEAFRYTARGNLVAVITNGTAVLGLGNVGPLAGKPVMEGKALLFKRFADVDVFDIEIDATDPDDVVRIVKALEPTFGGINLEDISAPQCFEIEQRLSAAMDIPVFHDDQHGTAIISGAALLNALELTGKDITQVRMAVSGAGAAAIACCEFFVSLGMRRENIVLADTKGVIYRGRTEGMNAYKARFATDRPARTLAEAVDGADIFLGVSVAGMVTKEMVLSMADAPIVFALANPDPEISYPAARAARSDVLMATGRSDYPNQVNNVLGFPFIFRGALDVRARTIDNGMMVAAARALADLAKEDVPNSVLRAYGVDRLEFGPEYLIPKPLDPRVPLRVAPAVAAAAMASGVARNPLDLAAYTEQLANRLTRGREVMSHVTRKAQTAPKRVVFSEGEEQQDHPGGSQDPAGTHRAADPARARRRNPVGDEGAAGLRPHRDRRPRDDQAGRPLRRRTARKAAAERNHPARGSCAAPPAELLRGHDGPGGRRRRLRRRPDLPLPRRHPARPASDRAPRPGSHKWPGCT